MLIYGASEHNGSLYKDAGKFFALVCVFEALVALAVFNNVFPQPFQSSYASIFYWRSLGDRQTGTLDHPLCLGLLLAAGIPMVVYFDSTLIAILAASSMVIGTALTQSRIAALGAAIGIIYVLALGLRTNYGRIVALSAGGIGIVVASNFGVFRSLIDRIANDGGSSKARTRSWTLFLDTWNDFGTVGVGMEGSKEYFLQHGLRASGESATVAYAVGIGIPLTFLYMAIMIWLIGYGIRKSNRLTPASVAAIVSFISIQLFSSISTESAAGIIVWATIGISLASPRMAPQSPLQDTKPGRVRDPRLLRTSISTTAAHQEV